MVNGDLRDGWEWKTLDDVASNEKNAIVDGPFGSNLKVSDYVDDVQAVPVLTTKNLEGKYGVENLRFISQQKFEQLKRSEVRSGDILIAKIGSCGKTGIYPQNMRSAIIPANLLKFTVHPDVNRMFVYYYLNSPYFKNELKEIITATAQPAFSVTKFRTLPIPVPSIPEQERIVAKIEELFTQLDAGTSALERVQAGLRRYKASVLKAAVEGKLASQNSEGRMQNEGELPEGWKWVTIGEITQHLTSGSRGWAKYYSAEGSLFVRVGNFNRLSNAIDLEKLQFVIAPDTAEANRTRLKKRDLLITMTADVGMVGIVDERTLHWNNAYINQHVGLVRLENPDYVDYVSWALASEIGQKQFREKQYGLTKVGLNFDDIRSLEIPLPPLEEQRRIVAEVERRLSVAREVESVVEKALVRASRLRQAVLKSAFEGRLVR